jgi:hypothetical protein
MYGQVAYVQTVQSPHKVEASQCASQVTAYVALRQEERELRARVDFLELKAAQFGPLKVDVDLAMLLRDQKSDLGRIRQELDQLEKQLQTDVETPDELPMEVTEARIEQRLRDIKAKREQLLTYQQNLHYYEEKQAQLGLGVGIDLINEMKLTRARLDEVQSEIKKLEQEMKVQWGVEVRAIQGITSMSEEEINELAMRIVDPNSSASKWSNMQGMSMIKGYGIRAEKGAQELVQDHEKVNRAQIEKRKAEATKEYYRGVKVLLEELRLAIYPHSYTDKWEIYDAHHLRNDQTRVSIALQFDQRGCPTCFACCHYSYFGNLIGTESSSGLSRDSLIEALKKLHPPQRKKRRWQFWLKSLPAGWMK